MGSLNAECYNRTQPRLRECEDRYGQEVVNIQRQWAQNQLDNVAVHKAACRSVDDDAVQIMLGGCCQNFTKASEKRFRSFFFLAETLKKCSQKSKKCPKAEEKPKSIKKIFMEMCCERDSITYI